MACQVQLILAIFAALLAALPFLSLNSFPIRRLLYPTCRCFPGEPCWPSDESWDAFNKTLGGKLIKTVPIGAVCHTNQSFVPYDAAACAELQAHWNEADTHVSSPSSITAPFFADQSCDPFAPPSSPCSIGTYVQYTVRAAGASDYRATIEFAKSNNIRLTIRNSAHDYFGKVTGAGAIAIWTHHLKDINVFDYASKHYTGKAAKVGAGVSMSEISQALKQQGLLAVIGNAPTVGVAGGYTQGAGHGMIASRHGLAADQVLEWEVVTAGGELLTASPSKNQDLYWALSGGGGGTYGIVLSMTVKAHPDEPTATAFLQFNSEGISTDLFYETIATYLHNTLAITDAGVGSIFQLSSAYFAVVPILGLGKTKEKIDELVQPTIDALTSKNIPFSYESTQYNSFHDAYAATTVETPVAFGQLGGRLPPRSDIEFSTTSFTGALRTIAEKGGLISGLSFNVSRMPDVPNSVLPGWRRSTISLVTGLIWNNTDWNANLEAQRIISEEFIPEIDRVSQQAPSSYMNEAAAREPNWKSVFFGDNYPELLRIKKKYDPSGLFWARTAVGSDTWVEGSDKRLCRT
ncbi:FAD binding domain protein [Periconia macrospinosa]|uniref:FAD binding domain protein n=1 Tax=Periconia macrospinosa TaxID=97972 RepID=A0A2V1D9K6_9PLEO|nr:FAD binding domain protein [Periconia macrospinosa]